MNPQDPGPSVLSVIALEDITVSDTDAQKARRARFSESVLAELAESIRTHGVLQPIIVRTQLRGTKYELVAGERRVIAAREAGLAEIPAVVRTLTDEQVIEVQLIENLQRSDVHPMEEAEGYQQLMKIHGHPIEELHARVGKSRSYVYGRIKLLALTAKCRKAFYDGQLSASVALLLARIPVQKLQEKALQDVVGRPNGPFSEPLGYRRAADLIQRHYMLSLKGAPFPAADPKLVPKAGPCGACPKRTGNQPELFGDVSSKDVCTDPACFEAKTRAHGKHLLAEAKAAGRETITGGAAKRVAPSPDRGAHTRIEGFKQLDAETYHNGEFRKVRSVIKGQGIETALLQLPDSGRVVEVVKHADLERASKATLETGRGQDPNTEHRKKARAEKKFRQALYAAVRPHLPWPTSCELAAYLFGRLSHDERKELCRVRGVQPSKRKYTSSPDPDIVGAVLERSVTDGAGVVHEQLESETELVAFIKDCMHVRELLVPSYSNSKPERLLAAAKHANIDVAEIRRSVAPKKKAKKKAAKKKTKKKRAARSAATKTGARP